jgi:hypothetical protein
MYIVVCVCPTGYLLLLLLLSYLYAKKTKTKKCTQVYFFVFVGGHKQNKNTCVYQIHMYDNSASNHRIIPTTAIPSTVILEYPKRMYKYDYEYDNENGNDDMIMPAIPVSYKTPTFYQSFYKCICIPVYFCCKYSG